MFLNFNTFNAVPSNTESDSAVEEMEEEVEEEIKDQETRDTPSRGN